MAVLPENSKVQEWLDAAETIDQDSLDLGGAQYPWIQWVHGDKKLRAAGGVLYTGGWFCPADNMPVENPEGWVAGSLSHDAGDDTEGWFAQRITIVPIRSRRCWRVQDAGGASQFFAWDKYDDAKALGNPKGKLQILALVKGLGDEPMVLTLSGTAGRAFQPGGRGQTVMNQMRHCLIDPVNAMLRKHKGKAKFTWRAFWLTTGATDEPVFETVGTGNATSVVTPPQAIGLKPKMSIDEIQTHYIGREMLELVNGLYTDAEPWAQAWEQIAGEPETEKTAEPVEEVAEEEMPF